MAQNIYDDPDFFAGYATLARSEKGLDGAPEWPTIQSLLPEVKGKRVVDLGCGYGWFCRWAAEAGAADVLGLDVSEKMLAKARTDNAHAAIRYARADLDALELPEGRFDLAYSSLTLHYLERLPAMLATVHRALAPGGWLVYSAEHPIFMAPHQPGYATLDDGREVWPLDDYLVEGPRKTNWFAEGVVKQHRTLGTQVNMLIAAGFEIAHLEEWCPSDAQVAEVPAWARERHRPMIYIMKARRR
ncbi:MAG: class I SAM-dependent methyltransferase [Alphaproteobacteria bacterium]